MEFVVRVKGITENLKTGEQKKLRRRINIIYAVFTFFVLSTLVLLSLTLVD